MVYIHLTDLIGRKKVIPFDQNNLEADSSDSTILLVLQDQSSEAEHT